MKKSHKKLNPKNALEQNVQANFFSLGFLKKHKTTNIGRIALERRSDGKTVDYARIRTMDLPIPHQKH